MRIFTSETVRACHRLNRALYLVLYFLRSFWDAYTVAEYKIQCHINLCASNCYFYTFGKLLHSKLTYDFIGNITGHLSNALYFCCCKTSDNCNYFICNLNLSYVFYVINPYDLSLYLFLFPWKPPFVYSLQKTLHEISHILNRYWKTAWKVLT